ncbi:unnamed protein product [Phytophthora lilii]|uniref:Unnamed protein product n=1 Tax=Phytophthora lilii TaxID=2077276 RepID=A0A9W6TCM4_9STRA|nr:unnamed protein product [Phytophthora lilii]
MGVRPHAADDSTLGPPTDESISASQIDCSLELSPTIDALLETDDNVNTPAAREDVEDLLQNAVQIAFALSQPLLDSPTMMSLLEHFNGYCLKPSLKSIEDDVNMLKDGEDAKCTKTSIRVQRWCGDSEDDAVEPREYPEDPDLSDDEVALVDEAFLESLGGIDNIDKDALKAIEWGPPSSASYPNLSTDVATPIPELRDLANSPLLLFCFFMPKTLWVHITTETNRYRRHRIDARVVLRLSWEWTCRLPPKFQTATSCRDMG